ncbi:hypothetical protein [Longispora albida]|uniref:hypothetical protein n=1 Tax=Longispora albida TaxID=203523 RepID=UPI000369AEF6|nr:hypothetical protein [Longispora albida]
MLTFTDVFEAQRAGRSYKALADEVGIHHTAIFSLASGANTEFPSRSTIGPLAAALRVTEPGLIAAIAQGLGIDMGLIEIPRLTLAHELPPESDELRDPLRRSILDTIWSLVSLAGHPPRPRPHTPVQIAAAEPTPTLSALIRAHKGDRTAKALAAGIGIGTTTLHTLTTGTNTEFPRPLTLIGIAGALRVPQRLVVSATAVGLGFDMDAASQPASQFGAEIPPEADQLPEASRQAIIDLVLSSLAIIYAPFAPQTEDPAQPAPETADQVAASVRHLRRAQ